MTSEHLNRCFFLEGGYNEKNKEARDRHYAGENGTGNTGAAGGDAKKADGRSGPPGRDGAVKIRDDLFGGQGRDELQPRQDAQ